MGFENGRLVRVSLEAIVGGHSEVNTFHYDLDDGDLIDRDNRVQALADRFRDDVRPTWALLYRDDWQIQPVVVVEEFDPQNPTAARSSWTSGSPITGLQSGSDTLAPSGMCGVVQLRTASIGRRARGRLFLGGDVPTAHVDGNGFGGTPPWDTDVLQSVVDAIPREPDIVLGSSGSSADWCVYSRTQRAADLDPYAPHITSATVLRQIHWRRKRAGIARSA